MKHHFRRWFATIVAAWFVLNAPSANLFAQPTLSPPVWADHSHLQFNAMNCTNAGVSYMVQVSTNLTTWTPVFLTNSTSGSNFSFTLLATNNFQFFRVTTNMLLTQFGVLAKSNIYFAGNGCSFDSFDSSNPLYSTAGQYDITKRTANCNVGALSILTNNFNIGNCNIYGYVSTTTTNRPLIGVAGIVGDIAYQGFAKNKGTIELGHWTSNLDLYIPDVAPPNTAGWQTSLPPATNGYINLTGTNSYVIMSMPAFPFLVGGANKLWVNGHGSFPLGLMFTNGGNLVIYLGQTTGSGDALSWSGSGNFNVPGGYAKNFQIYGLPSLTSIDFHGVAAWSGTVYAPEASFVGGGGGNNTQDNSGAIIANRINVNGHWNFHYDQSLANSSFP